MKRRTLLLGGLAGAAGAALLLRPSDRGAPHAPYFRGLSEALDGAGHGTPRLVIDRAGLTANVATLRAHIGERYAYRIVAKSLPSLPLLQEVMQLSGSQRLMLFHQPFINAVATALPEADVLLGKPMPVTAAEAFYAALGDTPFNPSRQLRWLVDTPERARQYAQLAGRLGQDMLVAIELDVGMHRGGVRDAAALKATLDVIVGSDRLQFGGLMGYEPHIAKAAGMVDWFDPLARTTARHLRDRAMADYAHFVSLARAQLGSAWPADAVLNCGGSPTYQLYDDGDYPFNELAAGSCLVKPSDFDLATLADHQPASYIAAPVLKTADRVQLPAINLGPLHRLWDVNRSRTVFTYGGYWKATPVSPEGLATNPLYGRSTNQEMLNGSPAIGLDVDDWVFYRPTQSEFVFLQFGDIAVYENGAITAHWPVFQQTPS